LYFAIFFTYVCVALLTVHTKTKVNVIYIYKMVRNGEKNKLYHI